MQKIKAAGGVIIPISKLLGNYNLEVRRSRVLGIIPISKLLGNYNTLRVFILD